jgi:hypothetical protein
MPRSTSNRSDTTTKPGGEMSKEIGIHFGALSDSIKDQLTKQGFEFDEKDVERFDAQADAIVTLRLGGIMIDSAASKCQANLHAKIVKHVCKKNNLSPVKTFTK